MANVDNATGLSAVGHLTGAEIRTRTYTLTTGASVYKGDLVKAVAGGTVEVGAADIGTATIGVAAETVKDAASAGGKTIAIYDDPETIFAVQCDTGTAVAATDVFSTANHVAGSANTALGISGHELDSSQLAAQGGAQLKVIGLYDKADNAWGEHAKVLVIFNEHHYKAAVAGL